MFLTLYAVAQNTIRGTLYNYKTKKQLSLPKDARASISLIYSNPLGKRDLMFYKVSRDGTFIIPRTDLDSLSDTVAFFISAFYDNASLNRYNFADFEIQNIPKTRIAEVLSAVYLIPAYWKNPHGGDNYLIDNRRTFKSKEISIITPTMKYKAKRVPEEIPKYRQDVKYVADLNKMLIE